MENTLNKNWLFGRPLTFGDQEQIDYIREKELIMEADEAHEIILDLGFRVSIQGEIIKAY